MNCLYKFSAGVKAAAIGAFSGSWRSASNNGEVQNGTIAGIPSLHDNHN
jgi:hypothetical protein